MYRFLTYLLLVLLAFPGSTSAASDQTFVLVGEETAVASLSAAPVTSTEWRYTDDDSQSVGLHRYRLAGGPSRAVLFYLPGTNMNGTLKTYSEKHNLWLFLAARGITVFTMDYRTRFVPHDFSGDLSFMREWSMDLFVEDAGKAVAFLRQESGEQPLFIAGFSRGAAYAYALAGQVPAAGLVVLDGSFKQVPYKAFDLAGALARFDTEGRYASVVSRRGFEKRSELMNRAIDNPSGRAIDPRFASAGEQLADVLYRAWGPGVLANTRNNVSDIQVLAREMQAYDWFFPLIQDVEGASIRSSEDDPATWIDDHFGSLTIPVIYFGSGGFGADSLVAGIHSAARSGSKDVTVNVLENYGHLDVLFSREAVVDVYAPVLNWIENRLEEVKP